MITEAIKNIARKARDYASEYSSEAIDNALDQLTADIKAQLKAETLTDLDYVWFYKSRQTGRALKP